MKKQISKFLIAAILLTSVSACQQGSMTREDGQISKQTMGTVGGAVVGGLLGSKIGGGTGNGIAIGVGTLLGAMAGSSIGQSLDNADMQYYNSTSQRALEVAPVGQQTTWRNPDSGNYGTVTPTRTFQEAGQYCREYNQTITVGGKTEKAYGTACRQQDGSWKVIQ
jgi:surface antigen